MHNNNLHFDYSQLFHHEYTCVFVFLDKKPHNYICNLGLFELI